MSKRHWQMKAAVMGWLRYDRRCQLVCFERSPFGREYSYRPDVIGVTRDWRMVEVELKETLGDFKANARKRGLQLRLDEPKQFYFCVPPELVERVRPLLDKGQGLLTLAKQEVYGQPTVECVVKAAVNPKATRLTKLAVARMVMHQSATLQRAVTTVWRVAKACELRECQSSMAQKVPQANDGGG